MNKKNVLGQYYTPDSIAERMIDKALEVISTPKTVLELAAGEGHLLLALTQKVVSCEIYAVDIDTTNTDLLETNHPKWNIYNQDATSHLSALEGLDFDLALGNPPFLKSVTIDRYIQDLLFNTIGLHVDIGKKTRAEFIFICQYLSCLSHNGVLSIILPDTIITGCRSEKFREALINSCEIIEVVECSESSFKSTEAKTHILYLRNSKGFESSNIKVSRNFCENNAIYLNKSNAIKRLDFSYHQSKSTDTNVKLSDIAEVTRGRYTHKDLKSDRADYIHSTTFSDNFSSKDKKEIHDDHLISGDVIMCRVGTRVVGKTREYIGSPVPYSDCIYRIRFKNKEHKDRFIDYLQSETGLKSITSISRGVCSRYITKSDLESLNITGIEHP